MSVPVNPLDYAEVIDRVSRYYNTSADTMWSLINQYNLAPADLYGILPEAHQAVYAGSTGAFTATSAAGTPMYQAFNAPIPAGGGGVAESIVNSNLQTGSAASTFNTTYVASAEMVDNQVSFSAGGNLFSGGSLVGKAMAVAGQVVQGIGIVAAGAAAGKVIDKKLYQAAPDFWDGIGLSTLNPDKWNSLTSDMADTGGEGLVKRGINALLMIKPETQKTTTYMEKDAFDYLLFAMAHAGVFDSGSGGEVDYSSAAELTWSPSRMVPSSIPYSNTAHIEMNLSGTTREFEILTTGKIVCLHDSYGTTWGAIGRAGDTIEGRYRDWKTRPVDPNTGWNNINFSFAPGGAYPQVFTNKTQTIGDTTYNGSNYLYQHITYAGNSTILANTVPVTDLLYTERSQTKPVTAFQACLSLNNGIDHPSTAVPGVGNQPNATVPPISSSDSPEQVSTKVHGALPELLNDRLEVPTLQPDGTIKDVIYVPVPLPNGAFEGKPTIDPNTTPQEDPEVDPESEEDPLALILRLLLHKSAGDMPEPQIDPETEQPVDTPPDTPNPPDVGGGGTPAVVVPVGSASALWAVYNPTQAELNSLGAWLWSTNFVDQLLKMFNDPMQAIIGLHKTFIPPITGAAQDIKVGYLNSGVSSLTVPVQYSSVDCGSVDCAEYFGNVFDYSPYTRIYIYLPFIGFKELDVAQVMRGRIGVKYYGDAFTGACLAEVSVIRDNGAGGVLYTYSGDCAAKYPLSHGSYMGIVNAIAGIGIGIGTALAGAPSIGVASAVGMAQHARANVEHSGGFSGNSGAMGIKKPYLVIMRPQTAMANNYEHFTGQPSNSNVVLGSASGYVRVKECHVEDIATATDAEKQMIESALKTGIII